MDNSEYSILVLTLWEEHFRMFELHEIIRQRECKLFAEMLNRLREGKHTIEDIIKLKQRLIRCYNTNHPLDAPHFFIQNAKVNEFNDRVRSAMSGPKSSIKAHDNVIGAGSQSLRDTIMKQILVDNPIKTGQLHTVLHLAVGEKNRHFS